MYTDVHTYQTYVSGVLSFFLVSNKSSQGWLWFKQNMPEKNWIQIRDEKICHDYTRRDYCKMLHWSQDQGYTTTQRKHTRVSVLCKQTYYHGSKQQEEAVPICSTTIIYTLVYICTSIILPMLPLYLHRVWYVTGTCVHTLYTCQCKEM